MRSRVFVAVGLVLLAGAPLALLLSGHTSVATSADAEAPPISLAAVVVPVVVAMLLTRLVPPRLPALEPLAADGRAALVRQTWAIVGIAVAFPVVALAIGNESLWYGPAKLALLLGGSWLITRIWQAPPPGGREHRAALSSWAYWLGPVPAVVAWAYLLYYSPLAAARDMSGYDSYDTGFLVAAMLFTFVTASVTEELFYRVLLQTRIEALLGRWPGIIASALLFTAMHVHRIGDGPLWLVLLVILAWNGGFGLFVGYLWSRYRNVWAIIAAHTAVNALALVPILIERAT